MAMDHEACRSNRKKEIERRCGVGTNKDLGTGEFGGVCKSQNSINRNSSHFR